MRFASYRLLTRHFLRGFLENDLVSPDQGLQATLAPLLAAIATPGILLPMVWSFSYGWPYKRAEAFQALALRHEMLLVLLPMVLVALVTVLQWDSLYPDRRDAEVLGRLPVPIATMFWAKVSALLLFVGVFALASNGATSLLYPVVANIRPQPGLHGPLVTFVAHVVATFGGALFAWLGVLAMMGLLQLMLSARVRRAVSPIVQLASVLSCVLALLMLPFLMLAVDPHSQGALAEKVALHRLYSEAGGQTFDWAAAPKSSSFETDPVHGGMRPRADRAPADYRRAQDPFPGQPLGHAVAGGTERPPWVFWFPPFWFLGWYELLAGRGSATARLLANRAQVGLAAAAAVSMVCYLAAYRRHAAGAMLADGPGAGGARWTRVRRAGAWCVRMVVPPPAARAFFTFTTTTMVRSGKHRLILGAAIGAALAFVLAEASVGIEAIDPARPGRQLLSAQFVFAIFLLAGARFAFAVPTVLPANWAFRFHGPESVRACAMGTRRAMVACGLAPMILLLFPVYAALYGWRLAAMHGAIGFVASLSLIELLLAGFPKVPFASAYVPGRAMIRVRLTLYLMAFQFFAYVLSAIESVVLPRGTWPFAMLGVLALVYAELVRRRVARERTAVLVFDEDPPDTIQTLNLSGPAGQRLEARG